MPVKQEQRQISVSGPLDQDVLVFYSMTGSEELGRLFKYELDLLSTDANINLDDVLGKSLTIQLVMANDNHRYFNGYASNFRYMGMQEDYHLYKATLRPWLWFLTRSADCRIFQNKTIPDIIKEIFRDFGYSDLEDQLSETYQPWEYCVQYRETAFNFISRLMEQEGIYYYFKHQQDSHTLVLADSISAHCRVSDYEQISFYPPQQQERREGEYIDNWFVSKGIEPQRYTLSDFDFTKPKSSLEVRESIEDGYSDFEIFDYPGEYSELEVGQAAARARAEQLETHYERANAKGNTRALSVGSLFELTNYPRGDQNKEYLLLSARYYLRSDRYRSAKQAPSVPDYRIAFTAMDSAHPFRAAPITPQPTVKGPQTAIVVGPEGEKVWVDQYGRVKVQFHWDRYGKKDENSSCWIRVSQNWAGKNWGGMHIPHVGQEVIVEFLEGDPDRPLITGRVYNADNMPPLDLPENKHKSIIQDDYGNEIMFDGSSDDEHIRLYSPHHNSGLELGRSWVDFTKSDKAMLTFGNSFSTGVGTKTDFYGGSAVMAKLGLSSSLTMGLMTNLKWGAEFNWTKTSTNTQNKGPITQFTEKDILSLSGLDQVIAAGDQLCLVGGADKDKANAAGARSIVNVYPQSITLTVGPKTVIHKKTPTEEYKDQLYENYVAKGSQWQEVERAILTLAAASALIPLILDILAKKSKAGTYINILSSLAGVIGGVAIPAIISSQTKKITEESKKGVDEYIEPVEHKAPTSKIELHKDNGINIETKNQRINLECDKSSIWINEKNGNIIIETDESEKSTGEIQLFSKGNIVLDAKSNKIVLQADTIRGGKSALKFKNLMVNP